jgi:hypothetical protein
MDDLEIKHDAAAKTLTARFRIINTGPRTSPVAGRCVVVLKTGRTDPQAWLAMPDVTVVDGEPDGVRGQAFKISRYKDMEIKAMGQPDPSSFTIATVYVFDASGAKVLEKDFPIDLPAPPPVRESVAAPAARSAPDPGSTAVQVVPGTSAPEKMPVDQPAPSTETQEAAAERPTAAPLESDAKSASPPVPAGAPETDAPPTEGLGPVKREDTRSRF